MKNTETVLLLNNIRSARNVGSLLRTCDGLGVSKVIMCGITPYPKLPQDSRAGHIIQSNAKEIHKTALGAEDMVAFEHHDDAKIAILGLKSAGYAIYCLENNVSSRTVELENMSVANKFVLALGSETNGLEREILDIADDIIEIPMQGSKNSLNVSVAGAIALHWLLAKS